MPEVSRLPGDALKSRWVFRFATGGLIATAALTCEAQAVYKCESKGTVTYSHEPCLGASVVDTTPTQGLDKSSGQSRKGADVRSAEHDKAMAEVWKPLINETPDQRARRVRRHKLPVEERLECENLDGRLLKLEAQTRSAGKAATVQAESNLFTSRKRYRELRC
jgi:hypothetical protein